MDFITALGRLLRDGALRDDFAARPEAVVERLGVSVAEQKALLALSVAELEFQASVLLGKRFDLAQRFIPNTVAALGKTARSSFFIYARKHWPAGANIELQDAAEFCRYCAAKSARFFCEAEMNRLNFATREKNFAAHFVRGANLRGRKQSGLQIFVRMSNGGWREVVFYLGL